MTSSGTKGTLQYLPLYNHYKAPTRHTGDSIIGTYDKLDSTRNPLQVSGLAHARQRPN